MKLKGNSLIILAAVAGGSNLGMSMPKKEEVQKLLQRPNLDLEDAVMALWRQYMESDEMRDSFMAECKWWHDARSNFNKGRSKSADPAYIKRVWPHIAEVMGL
jgi:hypothetical protein